MSLLWPLMMGCRSEPPVVSKAGDRALTLIYSNNLDGEIEPCG